MVWWGKWRRGSKVAGLGVLVHTVVRVVLIGAGVAGDADIFVWLLV